MNDIKVTSNIDFKTYFGIVMRAMIKLRLVIVFAIITAVLLLSPSNAPFFSWDGNGVYVGILTILYLCIIPGMLYWTCKRNMKKSAFLSETLFYNINEDKITYESDTTSVTTGWKYIAKMMEREKFFY